MFEETRARIFLPTALCAWAFVATSCVRPLGPGFHFADRQTEIGASTSAPDHLHIRVDDQFDNVGNLPLRSLEVILPAGPNFGASNVRITVDGKEVSAEHSSVLDQRMMRTAFDPVWDQRQAHAIVTEWDMTTERSTRGAVAASAAAFYVADQTALPLWQSPRGFFTQGGPEPKDETLTVSAPPDFRVLAPGKPLKRVLAGSLATQDFRIMPSEDFLPFVVAGRYGEQVVRSPEGTVSFWTFGPLDGQSAQTAGARLSSSMRAFTDFFGPVSKEKTVVHIVEAPGELPAEFEEMKDAGGISFPEGALLDSRAFAQGIANEAVLQLTEYELAGTWFGWRVRTHAGAQILMGRGVGLFGLVIASEARGQGQRGRMVESLLERYDEARRIAADRPLVGAPIGYSRAESISTAFKAALFFVALEDLCGHDILRAAFRNIVQALWNGDVGPDELRSAVESASHRDLAEMFRIWLFRPGIPEDFRARYTHPASAQRVN